MVPLETKHHGGGATCGTSYMWKTRVGTFGNVLCLVTQSCATFCNPMDCTLPGSCVHGILQARILQRVAMPSYRGSSQPRDQSQVSHITVDSFPSEPPGKPKKTGVGSLSLLQGNFLIQESNQGLLHCRRILYQLSYQGISLIF